MPYYNEQLLSSWTPDFISNGLHYPPAPKIPQVILNTMKTNDNVAYAALPKELRGRRNVAVTAPRRPGGRFRSGKGSQEVCNIAHLLSVMSYWVISLNLIHRHSSTTPTSYRSRTVRSKSNTRSSA